MGNSGRIRPEISGQSPKHKKKTFHISTEISRNEWGKLWFCKEIRDNWADFADLIDQNCNGTWDRRRTENYFFTGAIPEHGGGAE